MPNEEKARLQRRLMLRMHFCRLWCVLIPTSEKSSLKTRKLRGVFLQAYQALKGGGQITELEGAKAESALNRMDKAQSKPEYIKAAREYQNALRSGMERAQRQAAGDYSVASQGNIHDQADAILRGR